MKTCINLANSTINLYLLYIKPNIEYKAIREVGSRELHYCH